MDDVLGAACFAVFLVAGWVATRRRTGRLGAPRVRVSLFLLYFLGVSIGVGVTRRELFPFFDWPLISGVLPDPLPMVMVVAVDSSGHEWAIDHRAWQPLQYDDMDRWLFSETGFFSLDSAQQRRAATYLIRRLNVARARALAGKAIGRPDAFLGPLAAPMFLIRPRVWNNPSEVPPAPIVGLRWYDETWDFSRRIGYARTRRVVRHEFREME